MSTPGPLSRLLVGLVAVAGSALAVVGGLALRPAGLVAVGLAAAVAGCLAAAVTREGRTGQQAVVDAAWKAGGSTVGVLLVLAGASVLGGPVLTLLLLGSLAAGWTLRRLVGGRGAVGQSVDGRPPRVTALSTGDLGREWVRTTAALRGPLDARTREAIVVRRQQTLDELERRDPDGFARWLSGRPLAGGDPTGELRRGDAAA